MWLSRAAFDALNTDRIQAAETAKILTQQNIAQQSALDWLRVRVQQLEQERAHLLWQYMGIKVQVPTVVPVEPTADDVLGGTNVFQDIGDDAAKKFGIDWADDGTVKQ